ncbi:MAG: ester cyclase [Dehalococcoidales bacterium]
MSTEQNKAQERRVVAEAINKGNLKVLDECLTPDCLYHGPGQREVRGIAGFKQFIAELRTAYPDIQVKIEDIVAEGNLVATRTFSTFTFTGRAGAVTPTGKKVSMTGAILDRFKGNKIAETWEHYDRLELYQQLGLSPSQPPPKASA